MSTSETSTTDFDNMCNIIIQATAQDGIVWEQSPHWDMTLDTVYRYLDKTLTEDDDITVVESSFSDMLDTMGLTDSGFQSYADMLSAWKAN